MQTIIKFFKTIFLVDLLKGMWVTLKYTPQPAFTFQYPAERRATSPRFRGVLRLQTEPGTGAQTCIVCDQCAKACPDDLIALLEARELEQAADDRGHALGLAAHFRDRSLQIRIERAVLREGLQISGDHRER